MRIFENSAKRWVISSKPLFFGEFFARPIREMPTVHAGPLDANFYFDQDTVRINRLRPEYHALKQLLKGCHSEAVLLRTTNPLCTASNLYWRIQSDQQRVTTRGYPVTLRASTSSIYTLHPSITNVTESTYTLSVCASTAAHFRPCHAPNDDSIRRYGRHVPQEHS